MTPSVISLSGYARTGKDTVFEVLQESCPGRVVRVAFADAVREFARDFYGVGDGTAEWWERHKEIPIHEVFWGDYYADPTGFHVAESSKKPYEETTGRDLLIHIGESMRALQPDFWLDMGQRAVEQALADGADLVVVTDARYRNEVQRMAEIGAATWLLTRPGTVALGSSDRAVDEIPRALFDAHVANDGTLEDLRRKVAEALGLAT